MVLAGLPPRPLISGLEPGDLVAGDLDAGGFVPGGFEAGDLDGGGLEAAALPAGLLLLPLPRLLVSGLGAGTLLAGLAMPLLLLPPRPLVSGLGAGALLPAGLATPLLLPRTLESPLGTGSLLAGRAPGCAATCSGLRPGGLCCIRGRGAVPPVRRNFDTPALLPRADEPAADEPAAEVSAAEATSASPFGGCRWRVGCAVDLPLGGGDAARVRWPSPLPSRLSILWEGGGPRSRLLRVSPIFGWKGKSVCFFFWSFHGITVSVGGPRRSTPPPSTTRPLHVSTTYQRHSEEAKRAHCPKMANGRQEEGKHRRRRPPPPHQPQPHQG